MCFRPAEASNVPIMCPSCYKAIPIEEAEGLTECPYCGYSIEAPGMGTPGAPAAPAAPGAPVAPKAPNVPVPPAVPSVPHV